MFNLLLFVLLQLCDLGTTLVFLSHGVSEGNPLLAAAFRGSAHPALVLALAKLAGLGMGYLAWKLRRSRLLGRINLFFGACVVWNLAAIMVA
jgi:hypothetical protein